MRIPFLSRLMEIKEWQLELECARNWYLSDILKILKGGRKDGKRKM